MRDDIKFSGDSRTFSGRDKLTIDENAKVLSIEAVDEKKIKLRVENPDGGQHNQPISAKNTNAEKQFKSILSRKDEFIGKKYSELKSCFDL